jgi:hypothetical protein
MLKFASSVQKSCSSCNHRTSYGFFHIPSATTAPSKFLCSNCTQKNFSPAEIDASIETHRQSCFDNYESAAS